MADRRELRKLQKMWQKGFRELVHLNLFWFLVGKAQSFLIVSRGSRGTFGLFPSPLESKKTELFTLTNNYEKKLPSLSKQPHIKFNKMMY